MSITSEIQRINTNIANAYSKVENKGGTLPATQNSANLANAIDSIETGGGGDLSEYFDTTISAGSSADGGGYEKLLKKLPSGITVSGTSLNYAFYKYWGEIPMLDTSNVTSMNYCCAQTNTTITMPLWDTSKVTTMQNCFYSSKIKTIPLLDTSKVQYMNYMFASSRVENIPVLDTSSVLNMNAMFEATLYLTNQTLDNILQMCINATNYTGAKTLSTIGFHKNRQPSATIQALTHYQDFIDAGWQIGY